MQCNRDLIINLTLAAVIVVLLLRRYLAVSDASAVDEPEDLPPAPGTAGAPLKHVAPTPTAIPGPSSMRAILGKCKRFQQGVGPTYEFCGFRSVKQIMPTGSHYTGFWGKWITEEKDGKKVYKGQLYSNGENCPGFGNRQTTVFFECRKDAKDIEFIGIEEPEACKYNLKLGLSQWCDANE